MRSLAGVCFVLLASLPVFFVIAEETKQDPAKEVKKTDGICKAGQEPKQTKEALAKCSKKCGDYVVDAKSKEKIKEIRSCCTTLTGARRTDEKGDPLTEEQCRQLEARSCENIPANERGYVTYKLPNGGEKKIPLCAINTGEEKQENWMDESHKTLGDHADAYRQRLDDAAFVQNTLLSAQMGQELDDATSRALNDALGRLGFADQSERDTFVENFGANPGSAQDLLKAIADGDSNALAEAAIGLNLADATLTNLANNMSSLQAPDVGENPGIGKDDSSEFKVGVCEGDNCPESTFKEQEGLEKVALSDDVAPMCARLGGCSVQCNPRNPLVCVTQNPGAVVCSPIARRFGCTTCHPNNNTAICPSMEAGIALQAALLRESPRYFGSGQRSILGAFCNGYSARNCGVYAQFIANQTGIPLNQSIDPNNTEQLARIMMASSRFESGRGVLYSPEQLQQGLEIAHGTRELPASTPGYVAQNIPGGLTGATSPFNIGYGNNPFSGAFGSPFGSQVGTGYPTTVGSPGQSGYVAQSGYAAQSAYVQGVPPNALPPAIPVSQIIGQQGGAPQTVTPVQPAMTIIVHNKEIDKGNGTSVSWSSVGITTSPVCRITQSGINGTSLFAEGNEGTKRFKAEANSASGTVVLTLICTSALSGQSIEKSEKITVK